MDINNGLIILYESYSKKKWFRALIGISGLFKIPLGSADNIVNSYVSNIKGKRLKVFYDILANDDVELTKSEILENDESLHAYFTAKEHVERTRSNLKIEAFARILLSVFKREIEIQSLRII